MNIALRIPTAHDFCVISACTCKTLPWVPEEFFLVGSGEAAKASREATRKNLWHQRITTSLPCRRQFPLIDIRSQSLFWKHSKPVFPTRSKICVSCFTFTFHEWLCPFFCEKSSDFPFESPWKSYFVPQTNTSHLINYRIDRKVRANCENLQRCRFASWVKVSQL